jgi:hypothetical protein
MHRYHIPESILPVRFHFSRQDIEKIARDELRQVDCLPKSPAAIPLERYLSRRHHIEPRQTDRLPPGVLGAADLADPAQPVIWIRQEVFDGPANRYRSTLAHEIAHLVLHTSLYIDPEFSDTVARCNGGGKSLARGFQCGNEQIQDAPHRPTSNAHPLFHLEFQANLGMVAFLTPTPLVKACVAEWTREEILRGGQRVLRLEESHRQEAIARVAETFEVSRELAGYRLGDLFPPASGPTLSPTANHRPAHKASGNLGGETPWKTQTTLW